MEPFGQTYPATLEVDRAAYVEPMADGPGTLVVAPLPADFASATALRFERPTEPALSIAPSSVRVVFAP